VLASHELRIRSLLFLFFVGSVRINEQDYRFLLVPAKTVLFYALAFEALTVIVTETYAMPTIDLKALVATLE